MPETVRDLVGDYLTSLIHRGETRLPLDDSARKILTNWMKAARKGQTCPSSHQQVKASHDSSPKPSSALYEGTPVDEPPAIAQERLPELNQGKNPALLEIPDGTVEDTINYLRNKAIDWAPARELGTLRTTMVFSTGNPRSPLMLIGEAPGFHEERLQEPFVGPAGEKLNQILKAMGLNREDIYISNIVKFRPSLPNQTTNNRQPSDEEIASCLPLILEEIRAIKPKAIVALGGTAAQGLLGRKASVSSLRGRFHEVEGIPMRVTYHPSYLLRSENNRDKRLVWEDMLSVMEQLEMPVTDKQRSYFLPK